jgi:large subunit ribosomal protein L28e
MSSDLIWQLVKDNNSFLVKRGRTARLGAVQFSKEPGNLLGVNSFKYSGIATAQPIVFNHSKSGVTVTTKVR